MQTKGTFSEQEPEVADPNGLYVISARKLYSTSTVTVQYSIVVVYLIIFSEFFFWTTVAVRPCRGCIHTYLCKGRIGDPLNYPTIPKGHPYVLDNPTY